MERRSEVCIRRFVGAFATGVLLVLTGGCNTGSLAEQRRESIRRYHNAIHLTRYEEVDDKNWRFDPVRPIWCATDEVQSLASPVFATSGQRTAGVLAQSKDMLRICQGCAVRAAGVAVWQPDLSPALPRHREVLFQVGDQVIHDTDLGSDERYRTKEAPSGLIYGGTAVPITKDGYFLTAAHVVDLAPRKPSGRPQSESPDGTAGGSNEAESSKALVVEDFHVACMTVDGTPTLARARVVWRSMEGPRKKLSTRLSEAVPDLAIFHADIQPARIALFAKPDEVKPDVLVIGGRALQFNDYSNQTYPHCAGMISDVDSVPRDGHQYTQVRTTAPAAPGDSGGPVITTQGRLVAIATAGGQELTGQWVSWAWMLPEAEIFAIVDADRLSQAGK